MTQAQLAEKVGISLSFLGHIERGTRIASVETLLRISIALKMSLDLLLQDSMPEKLLGDTEGLTDSQITLLTEIANVIREHNE